MNGTARSASPMGAAAMVTVLHLALLAGRVNARHVHPRQGILLSWRVPPQEPQAEAVVAEDGPSNPIGSYSAGRLALTTGMAVVVLACWLQIMHVSGSRAY